MKTGGSFFFFLISLWISGFACVKSAVTVKQQVETQLGHPFWGQESSGAEVHAWSVGLWGLQLRGARGSLDGRCRLEERKGPESHHHGSEHSDGGPGEWAEIQGTQQRAVSLS